MTQGETEGLRDLWMEVLGIARFDPEEDFFMAGGDSLKATTLMAGILDRYGVAMEEIEVFWNPRFDDFEVLVQAAIEESASPPATA